MPALSPAAAPTDLLRFSTAGSVDDGKSTLIGRLLYETKAIFEDQLAAIERASRDQGADEVNLALLTDGLRAEREQGITIDVAYRYFATPRRRFILADTPGHVQYTRNMVTGASNSDLAIVLIDASRGITEQSRRHLFLAALLRIPRVVVCINKLDLVAYSADRFAALCAELHPFLARLALPDPVFIPVSALRGDNVVEPSPNLPWYTGPTLLHHLEQVPASADSDADDARFPVQWVIRPRRSPHRDYRGYAGRVAGGVLRPGDRVVALPEGWATRITAIDTFDGPLDAAFPGMSVTVTLEDEIDISRGDVLSHPDRRPMVSQDLTATVCWFSKNPLVPGKRYALKLAARSTRAVVTDLSDRVDVNSLERDVRADALALNEIGRVRLRAATPLIFDPYTRNRSTGCFILIDEGTNETAGAGLIEEEAT